MRLTSTSAILLTSLLMYTILPTGAQPLQIHWERAPQESEIAPPEAGLPVWQAEPETPPPVGKMAASLGQQGSVQFWFRPNQSYVPERGIEALHHWLLELPGLLDISIRLNASAVTLFVQWHGEEDIMFERHIRMIIPTLPGDQWIHFALTWDADEGLYNALLNGTPFYTPGVPIEPVEQGQADTVHIGTDGIPLAGLRITEDYVPPEDLRASLPADLRDSLAHLLGARRLPPFDAEHRRGRLLYANAMDHPDRVESWVMEGPGVLTAQDGWLHMQSERPDGPQGHMVFWCPENFPTSFIAEWEFILEGPVGLCIVFFAATGPEGQSIFAPEMRPRSGEFGHYVRSDLHAYHISYYASTPWVPRSMANLRKNPGLHLLGNGPIAVRAESGKVYRAQLVKDGPRIRMSIDGHTIIDNTDTGEQFDQPLKGGKIGFRQMQWTEARYRNFRVHALNEEKTPGD